MKSELLAHSPALALPLVALFLFVGVYLGVFFLTMRKKKGAYDPIASMPLADGEGDDR